MESSVKLSRIRMGNRGKLANCLALLLWLTVSAQFALAHDSWISRKQYRNPWSGAWCCDDHDCSPIDDRDIQRIGHGFLVVGTYLVSYDHVLPSGDDRYWVCFNKEGTGPHDRAKDVRCLFVPANS